MSYGSHSPQMLAHALPTADVLTATGDDLVIDIFQPCTLRGIRAVVTTAVVSTGAVVVACDRRVLTGSDVGRVDGANSDGEAVLTIPAAAAVGKVYYDELDAPVDLNVGDQLVFEVTTAAAGAGSAGGARYAAIVTPRDETPANQSDMVSV